MAPSMAANINPQGASGAGRAVPLAFLIAAVGVLLVAYTFVRLCQYYRHSGSAYAFVGATLGPRAGVVAGWGLVGTYTFYAVTTAGAAGVFGSGLFDSLGIWKNQPSWSPILFVGVALALALLLAALPPRAGRTCCSSSRRCTVALILVVTVTVLVKVIGHTAPGGAHFTMSVFSLSPGTSVSALFLGVVFGFLSFAGFEASATLGEEAHRPSRDIPRAILGVAIFGGVYFVVVTAAEVMGFGTSSSGLTAFAKSPSLLGDLGSSYVGSWVGNVITAGTTVSAFGCCLASTVAAARVVYAMSRDSFGSRHRARRTRWGTPAAATGLVTAATVIIYVVYVAVVAGLRGGGERVLLVGHDRHADPARGVRAGDGRHGPAGIRAAENAIGAHVADSHSDRRDRGARLHALPERVPVSAGDGYWFPIVGGAWLAAAVLAVLSRRDGASGVGAALGHAARALTAGAGGHRGLQNATDRDLAAFREGVAGKKGYLPGSGTPHWTAAVILL